MSKCIGVFYHGRGIYVDLDCPRSRYVRVRVSSDGLSLSLVPRFEDFKDAAGVLQAYVAAGLPDEIRVGRARRDAESPGISRRCQVYTRCLDQPPQSVLRSFGEFYEWCRRREALVERLA